MYVPCGRQYAVNHSTDAVSGMYSAVRGVTLKITFLYKIQKLKRSKNSFPVHSVCHNRFFIPSFV